MLRAIDNTVVDAASSAAVSSTLLQCHGFLGTSNISLGLDDVGVEQAVRAGLRGDKLIAIMRGMNLYRHAFDTFAAQVGRWATAHNFDSHAASMELCLQGNFIQRVHLHAFLGPPVDFVAWEFRRAPSLVDVATLKWLGSIPHVRCIRGHSKFSMLRHESVGGLYYVLMEKPGAMFRAGNRWPFQDCSELCMSDASALWVNVVHSIAKSRSDDFEPHCCRCVTGFTIALLVQRSKLHVLFDTTWTFSLSDVDRHSVPKDLQPTRTRLVGGMLPRGVSRHCFLIVFLHCCTCPECKNTWKAMCQRNATL